MRQKVRYFMLEFKQKVVELSYLKSDVKLVGQELDISPSIIYRWRKELKDYGKNSFPGRGTPKMTDEQKEIARLKRELQDSKLECDILKKAVSIFSRSDRKNTDL